MLALPSALRRRPLALERGALDRLFGAGAPSPSPAPRPPMRIVDGVAVLPVHGILVHRAADAAAIGGTAIETLRDELRQAVAAAGGVLFDFDSPGGSVDGVEELAAELRAVRLRMPVVAFGSGAMTSAAYWLAASGSRVYASPTAAVGGVGIAAAVLDDHRARKNAGVDPVLVKSTAAKGGMQGNGTFSDADRADLQREVDALHALFVGSVAAGRGITFAQAQALADGRVYVGADAARLGFVDGVCTLDDAMAAAAGHRLPARGDQPASQRRAARRSAEDDQAQVQAAIAEGKLLRLAIEHRVPAARAIPIINAARGQGPDALDRARWQLDPKLRAEFADDEGAYMAFQRHDRGRRDREAQPHQSAGAVAGGDEPQWRAEWSRDPQLRAEFLGDEASWLAYCRHERGRHDPGSPPHQSASDGAGGDEQQWCAEWARDPQLRAEFLDDEAMWLAYCRHARRRGPGS